ncbi:MAG: hypothetical protein L0Y68_08605 [Candidatus Dadabacteria bacterium]|nr:hypothetical protein [Candidatus Dadabacteria bacterium]
MKKISKQLKTSRKEEKAEAGKPKKEFKIEVVKVGKLEERTGGLQICRSYECQQCKCPPPT